MEGVTYVKAVFKVATNGKILAKGGICSTTVDSSTNDG